MDYNLVVEVLVPKRGSAGKKVARATGYPVSKDLILTARHVLDQYDPEHQITLRWRHPLAGPEDPSQAEPVDWDCAEGLDVALLKGVFPKGIADFGYVSPAKPDDKMNWTSSGFARAGGKNNDGVPETFPLAGKVLPKEDRAHQFHLQVIAPPETQEYWKGCSGSPVFVGPWLIGVIVVSPDHVDAARLHATPTRKLLEDDEFCQLIGRDKQHQQRQREQFRERLIKVLQPSPVVMKELCDSLAARGVDVNSSGLEQHVWASALAERLLALGYVEVIDMARASRKALRQRGDEAATQVVSRLVQLLLPAVCDSALIERVRGCKNDTGMALVSIPAGTCTLAEMVMAGVDLREMKFRRHDGEDLLPEGLFSLPLPPEGGFDASGDVFKDNFNAHLLKLIPAVQTALKPDASLEREVKKVAGELQYQAEEGRTRYLLYTLNEQTPDFERRRAIIVELKQAYPALVFLNLSDDDDLYDDESEQLRPLDDILHSSHRSEAPE